MRTKRRTQNQLHKLRIKRILKIEVDAKKKFSFRYLRKLVFLGLMTRGGNSIEGELCNGIAYIDWGKLHSGRVSLSDSPLTRCIGRYHKFTQPETIWDKEPPPESHDSSSSKYVRTLGSTAILYMPRDSYGRRVAVARSVGPIHNGSAVEIGPIEESIVDWSLRWEKDGFDKTVIEPWRILMERSGMVAKRSVSMFMNGVVPVSDFAKKMKSRVPELVRETYELATSVRVEIKIEEHRPAGQGPPSDEPPHEK